LYSRRFGLESHGILSAWDHAEALVALDDAKERIAVLEALLATLAHTTPHEGA